MKLWDRIKGLRIVNVNSLFKQAMFGTFASGSYIETDWSLVDIVKECYERSPVVFGMASKLARMAAGVKLLPMNNDDILDYDPIKEFFSENESDYTYKEFLTHWYLFAYVLGEPIVYWPKLSGGNDKGKLVSLPEIIPPQNVMIESGGWREMVKYYRLTPNQRIPIEHNDIWHTRAFLNLDFENGKNYRALSPIKVAADIIKAMNEGQKTTYQTLKKKMPMGILGHRGLKTLQESEETQAYMDRTWDAKFANSEAGKPIIGSGDMYWIPMSFSSIKDLQIVENSNLGRSILCNLWGVPEELFSSERSTLDNKTTARKLAYEDSIIPMVELYTDGLNKRVKEPYNIEYKPDINSIPAMQEDKQKIATTMKIGRDARAVTKNEFRISIGLEEIDNPEFGEEGLIDEGIIMPNEFNQQKL